MGTITGAVDLSTFKSAYAYMIRKIMYTHPYARIMAGTNIGGRVQNDNTGQPQDFQTLNGNGHNMSDISNAVLEVCKYYGVPCIDLNAESFINTVNSPETLMDVIHPSQDVGGKLLATAIINGLKRFEPINHLI